MEETKKRVRRSKSEVKDQKIKKYMEEIAKHQAKIAELNKKIDELDTPTITMRDVTSKIKELGLSPDDVLKAVEKIGKK